MSDRRSNDRFSVSDTGAAVKFGYPTPKHDEISMQVRDISRAGLSFHVARELPGLEVGKVLEEARLTIGARDIRGDLVVMHLTPYEPPDKICGAIFCPAEDEDILELRELIRELGDRKLPSAESA